MNTDWTGNAKSAFTTNGASGHSERERESHDFYATDPRALELLLQKKKHFVKTSGSAPAEKGI